MSIGLRGFMQVNKVAGRLYGREKRAYAIWRKLEKQNISFDDVADIFAFRIIVKDITECYRVLGLLHQKIQMCACKV